jgi:hypothetical protein
MLTNNNKTLGIFNLDGVKNTSHVKINHSANIEATEKINDNMLLHLPLDKANYIQSILYKANVTQFDLMRSKKQPVLYLNILFSKTMKVSLLYTLTLYFNIIDKSVKSQEDLLNNEIKGEFTLELQNVMTRVTTKVDKPIVNYVDDNYIGLVMANLMKTDKYLNIFRNVALQEDKRLTEQYNKEHDDYQVPIVTFKPSDVLNVADYY